MPIHYFEKKPGLKQPVVFTNIAFDGHSYTCKLFLTPIEGPTKHKIAESFGSRIEKRAGHPDKFCLMDEPGTDAVALANSKARILKYHKYISAYMIVERNDPDSVDMLDTASGMLQFMDLCFRQTTDKAASQVWLASLCRTNKREGYPSPVRMLIKLAAQLVVQLERRDDLWLIVHKEESGNPHNGDVLVPMYTRYGFQVVDDATCPMENDPNEVAMCMSNIQEDLELVDFRSRVLSKKRGMTRRSVSSEQKRPKITKTGAGKTRRVLRTKN